MLQVIKNRIGGVMVSVLASSEAQVNRIIYFNTHKHQKIKYYILFVPLFDNEISTTAIHVYFLLYMTVVFAFDDPVLIVHI
jgi:hypothetical protein